MKNKLVLVLIGFIIFVVGVISFSFELNFFDTNHGLATSFEIKHEVVTYPITSDQTYRITNADTNNNINLYIDNNLSNQVKIILSYPNVSKIKQDYSVIKNGSDSLVHINFSSSTRLDLDTINNMFELGVLTFKNKVIYNYSLFEYPEVKIYVHENYRENIEFVGNYGKVYNPIR